MNSRRTILAMLGCTALGILSTESVAAQADAYPVRPIRLIVGFAPGGANDLLARLLADKLATRLGQPVVVDNRPGAGGTIGAGVLARAEPDGYTLMSASVSNIVLAESTIPNLPYDPLTDFIPIIKTASVPLVLVVPNNSQFNSVQELISAAKKQPGTLNFSSGGVGTSVHLAGELFNKMAKIEITHIPYSGDGPAVVALLSRDVSMTFAAMPSVSSLLHSGKLKPLAVAAAKRVPSMPDVPTIEEAGISGFEVNVWHGLFAPAKTSPALIEKLHDVVAEILLMPDVQKKLLELGFVPGGGSSREFYETIKSDMETWPALISDVVGKK